MNQVANVNPVGTNTLTSVEIAELTGKQHKNVMRDIENMLNELGISPAQFSAGYIDQQGKPRPCFALPSREVKILITGYDVVRRAKVIDRLEQLEAGGKPYISTTYGRTDQASDFRNQQRSHVVLRAGCRIYSVLP